MVALIPTNPLFNIFNTVVDAEFTKFAIVVEVVSAPQTVNFADGLVVPIPTLPLIVARFTFDVKVDEAVESRPFKKPIVVEVETP